MALRLRILLAVFVCNLAGEAFGASLRIDLLDENSSPTTDATCVLLPATVIGENADAGRWFFRDIPPGEYCLRAEAGGYARIDTCFSIAELEEKHLVLTLASIARTLEAVEVSTNRRAGIRLFTREEIEKSGENSLPDFLEKQAGLAIRSDGTAGGETTVRIGGSNANQVMVIVDGRKIQSSASGEADLSVIPLHWIEEIEICRGSDPELGGEAIGGILKIVTRQAAESEELMVHAQTRSNYTTGTVSRSGSIGSISSFVSYLHAQGPGNYRYEIIEDDGNGEFTNKLGRSFRRINSDIRQNQLFAKLAGNLARGYEWEVTGISNHRERGMPGYLAPRLTPLARQRDESSAMTLMFRGEQGSWRGLLHGSLTQQSRNFSDPDPLSLVHAAHESDRRLEAAQEVQLQLGRTQFSAGSNEARESFISEQLSEGDAARNRWAVWSKLNQSIYSVEKLISLEANAGVRQERFGSDFSALLPKCELTLSSQYLVTNVLSVGWGKSYRAPSFYSLFWKEDQVARGNSNLLPEQSGEWSGHWNLRRAGDFATGVNIHASSQNIGNLIYWQQTFDGHWQPQNLKSATVRDLEIDIEQSIFGNLLQLTSAINWTEARDATADRTTGGKYLTFRAPRSHRGSLQLFLKPITCRIDYRWYDARPALTTNFKWLSEYSLIDVAIQGDFIWNNILIRPEIGVANLLDEPYRIIRHAPMPQRELILSLQLGMRS